MIDDDNGDILLLLKQTRVRTVTALFLLSLANIWRNRLRLTSSEEIF
jgi:hypothetical protein